MGMASKKRWYKWRIFDAFLKPSNLKTSIFNDFISVASTTYFPKAMEIFRNAIWLYHSDLGLDLKCFCIFVWNFVPYSKTTKSRSFNKKNIVYMVIIFWKPLKRSIKNTVIELRLWLSCFNIYIKIINFRGKKFSRELILAKRNFREWCICKFWLSMCKCFSYYL